MLLVPLTTEVETLETLADPAERSTSMPPLHGFVGPIPLKWQKVGKIERANLIRANVSLCM